MNTYPLHHGVLFYPLLLNFWIQIVYRKVRNLRIVTVWAKTHIVCTKTEFNYIAIIYRHTQYLSIPSVSVLNVNWSAFLKGILLTFKVTTEASLEGANWVVETYICSEWLWPTGIAWATVRAPWLLIFATSHPISPHPTLPHHQSHPPLYKQYWH